MVGTITAQLKRAKTNFISKMEGMIFGIVIGDALGLPFQNIPPGKDLYFNDQKIDFIDRFYLSDIGFRNTWPLETTLALNSCKALIEIHEHDQPLKETIDNQFLEAAYLNYVSDEPEHIIVSQKESVNLYRLNRQDGLFMKLAPAAPFAHRCRLDNQQTMSFAYRVAAMTEDAFSKIFPAFEFLMILKSIFSNDKLIPDVLDDIRIWAENCGHKSEFDDYLETRHFSLEKIAPGSDLWIWKKAIGSILGFVPGERWTDIQGFESAVVKIVNESYYRSKAGAIGGAILGAAGGRERLAGKYFRLNLPPR
jgi:hypothetical protein